MDTLGISVSPVGQLDRSEKMTAFTLKPDSFESGLPYQTNPDKAFARTTLWCRVKGQAATKSGNSRELTVYFPSLSREDVPYPNTVDTLKKWVISKDDEPLIGRPMYMNMQGHENELVPKIDVKRIGLQLQYPRANEISKESHFLVLTDNVESSTITAFGVLPLANRTPLFATESKVLATPLLQAYRLETDWQYRQLNHWVAGVRRDPPRPWGKGSFNSNQRWVDLKMEDLLTKVRGYRRAKLIELKVRQTEKWTASQDFIHKFNPFTRAMLDALESGPNYYSRNLDPASFYYNRWTIVDDLPGPGPEVHQRALKLLKAGVVNREVQDLVETNLLSKSDLVSIGVHATILGDETVGRLVTRTLDEDFREDSNPWNLTFLQKEYYTKNCGDIKHGIEFIQEFCRWKLGRPTAEWFPRE
jgi:hypothetical protein